MSLLPILNRFLEAVRRISKERALARIEAGLEAAMAKAFRAQGAAFLKRFAGLKGKFPFQESVWWHGEAVALREAGPDWERLFTAAELETLRLFLGPLDVAVKASLLAGALAAIADVGMGLSFDLKNPRAVAYLKVHGAELVKGVNATTRDYLKTVITQAVDEGWSYDRTAKTIIERYSEFAVGRPQQHIDSRAHMIAVTESGNAYCAAGMVVAQDLADGGLEMQKSWQVTGGEICEICLANAAEGWIPLAQAFSSGDQQPLAHPACRCDWNQRVNPDQKVPT